MPKMSTTGGPRHPSTPSNQGDHPNRERQQGRGKTGEHRIGREGGEHKRIGHGKSPRIR